MNGRFDVRLRRDEGKCPQTRLWTLSGTRRRVQPRHPDADVHRAGTPKEAAARALAGMQAVVITLLAASRDRLAVLVMVIAP
jgi:hypothetical protein